MGRCLTQDGTSKTVDFSITGGGSKAAYRFSANYFDQLGTTIGTDFSRITSRLNLDYFISDKLKMRADFTFANSTRNSNYADVRGVAYRKMPNMSIYEYDSYGNLTGNYFSPLENAQGTYSRTYNPVAMANDAINRNNGNRVTSKYSIYYDIIPGLRYSLDLSFDVNTSKTTKFLPQSATGQEWISQNDNRPYNYDSDSYYIYSRNMLTYSKKFGEDHDFNAVANWTTYESIGDAFNITTSNTASKFLTDPSSPSKINESGLGAETSVSHGRSIGSAMMASYKYKDKYISTLGLRMEGNSKFDANNRYFLFPSLTLAWRISSEEFMRSTGHWLDDLRLRASFGQTVNLHVVKGCITVT